jgi:hypothetical protein
MLAFRPLIPLPAALAAVTALTAVPGTAQEPLSPAAPLWFQAEEPAPLVHPPERTADPDTRSPLLAGALELLMPVPTLGYAYAGNWRRGLLPGGIQVLGLFLVSAGVGGVIFDGLFDADDDASCGALCPIGATMIVGGRVWATVGAARTARTRSLERGGALSLQWVPTSGGTGILVAYRF